MSSVWGLWSAPAGREVGRGGANGIGTEGVRSGSTIVREPEAYLAGVASDNPPNRGCGCDSGAGAGSGKTCVSPCGREGMPARMEATERGGGEMTIGAGAGLGETETAIDAEAATKAGGTAAGGERGVMTGEGGGEFGRGIILAANLSPRTAAHFHPFIGSQTLSIRPSASVDLTSRKVSFLSSTGRCRGGERREPGRAHAGTGGGDRDRDRARARRSRRGRDGDTTGPAGAEAEGEEEGEDDAVCGPAAGTEEAIEKKSCSQASHPKRVKTAAKKRNAIEARLCDNIYV